MTRSKYHFLIWFLFDPVEHSPHNEYNYLIEIYGVSLQKAGIEFGIELTARLLTRLDPKKEGFINYT